MVALQLRRREWGEKEKKKIKNYTTFMLFVK